MPQVTAANLKIFPRYFVHYSDAKQLDELARLETEFIHDHKSIIESKFNIEPPWNTTCKSVGLAPAENDRKQIAKTIAARRDKTACTLTV